MEPVCHTHSNFTGGSENLFKLSSVKWSHTVGTSILAQVKEQRLTKHLKEKLDAFLSYSQMTLYFSLSYINTMSLVSRRGKLYRLFALHRRDRESRIFNIIIYSL